MQRWPSHGLWRHPDFLRLWGAQIGSAVGSRITRTAVPLLAIGALGAGPYELGVLAAVGLAPPIVVGLVVGGHVDRTRKRRLLIGADLFRAAVTLTVPLAAWFGVLTMPQLYVLAAAVGAATSLFQIADNSFLPALVGPDQLADANAKLEATEGVAEGLGPGIAGTLIHLLTAPIAIGLDALSYLWSALLLSRIRAREEPAADPDPDATLLGDVWIGLRASLADPLVRPALLAEAVTCFFGGFYMTLYMLALKGVLGLSDLTIGWIVSVGGLGAVLAAWIAEPLARRFGTGPTLLGCLTLGLCTNLLIPLSLSSGSAAVPLLVMHQIVGDALLGAYVIQAMTLRQRVVPEAVLGRANATFHVVAGATLTVGALTAGPLAVAIGIPAVLWVAVVGALVAVPLLAPLAARVPAAR